METLARTRERDVPVADYRWSREQYERMIEAGVLGEDDRVELLNGRIVEMSPQNSKHATGIRLLQDALQSAYSDEPFFVDVQLPLAFGKASEPEPDLAVVAGSPRDYADGHPESAILVVEVADTSLLIHRTEKASLYAEHGVREYWILNVRDETLEVYRDAGAGTYQTKTTLRRADRVTPPNTERDVSIADVLP